MVTSGDVVLFEFPRTDQIPGKLRPALVLKVTPGSYDDYWIAMISSRLDQEIENFDEKVSRSDDDFSKTGLKGESVIRISRIAVVNRKVLEGIIGQISDDRLNKILSRLSRWLKN